LAEPASFHQNCSGYGYWYVHADLPSIYLIVLLHFPTTLNNSYNPAICCLIDKAASAGIKNVETKSFDRVQFQWNGKKSPKILMKFNCLSTDFSRIKGVKGIPLRVHIETKSESEQSLEKSFAKIKLFRDKGAERKNKDDQKHLDKMCDKMRGTLWNA